MSSRTNVVERFPENLTNFMGLGEGQPPSGMAAMHKVNKMHMYIPAIIALVAYLILALVIILPFDYPVKNENGRTYVVKYNFWQRLLTIILLAIPVMLSIYTINCLVGGNCIVWSYTVSIITAVWVIIFVVVAMIYTWSPKRQKGLPTTTQATAQIYPTY